MGRCGGGAFGGVRDEGERWCGDGGCFCLLPYLMIVLYLGAVRCFALLISVEISRGVRLRNQAILCRCLSISVSSARAEESVKRVKSEREGRCV